MYISNWILEEENSYYQAIVSLKENLTPFLKVRIIPLNNQKEYSIVIRDYNSGLLLASINLETERCGNGLYVTSDIAKRAGEEMVRTFLTGEGGIIDQL